MNQHLAEWLTRPRVARAIVAVAAVVGVGSAVLSTQVDHDDDVLAFLPEDDADVSAFRAMNEAFGGLDVAIVGLEADNPLDPELFGKLRDLTQTLNDASEVKFALSLANVSDFRPSPDGGIETDLLVRDVPQDAAGQRALKQKVMSRDLVVGQLIAPGGKAAILYAFAAFDSDPRVFAQTVQREVLARFPPRSVYFGGAPFVSTYIYDSTQADLRRLTPWAVGAIVLLVFLAFRDVRGVVLALLATTFGIVAALALMVVTGHRYNIVLSSMPVILFSIGSAYGIHVLARYYALTAEHPPREALVTALTDVGKTVLVAGGTTMAGLLSFLTMDIQPLRSFGLFTAAGIAAALLSSLTFVPAMVVVFGIRGPRVSSSSGGPLSVATDWVARRRWVAISALLLVGGIGAAYTMRVDTRMDQSAFFADDSPPARADRFLRRHFGGATFIQVHAKGDFSSPAVLRAWLSLADRVEALEHVSGVQHVGQVVAQLNAALAGQRRIPDTAPQVKLLYRFLTGMPALGQLVTEDRMQAVMHVKVSTNDLDALDETLAAVEVLAGDVAGRFDLTTTAATPAVREPLSQVLANRIGTLLRRADVPVPPSQLQRFATLFAGRPPPPDPDKTAAALAEHLRSSESLVDLSATPARADVVAKVLLRPDEASRREGLTPLFGADEEAIEDLLYTEETVGPTAAQQVQATAWMDGLTRIGLKLPGGHAKTRLAERIRDELFVALSDQAEVLVPSPTGASKIDVQVSGLPVLHRGLSRSARRNQVASLVVALSLVTVLLCLLFRSVRLGVAATVPTVATLAVVYGAMGVLGVHLDIGTSMLASLIIGAGVDYAVHLVAAHRSAMQAGDPQPLRTAVSATATAIWTNALMVAAGFYLLTLGEARTLQNVGGLTAAAMLVAAISTFGAVPALLPSGRTARTLDR